MAKIVFSRIWRTVNIIINSVWNLLTAIFAFMCVFDNCSSYTLNERFEQWILGTMAIIMFNILNHFTRKHFMNY